MIAFPLAALVLLVPSAAQAGPWVHSQDSHYAKVSYGAYVSEGARGADGRLNDSVNYLGQTAALYTELGVAKKTQLTLWLPYVVARNETPGTSDRFFTAGVADALVGMERGGSLDEGRIPISFSIQAKVPLYDQSELADGHPSLGDGQVDLLPSISVGRGWAMGGVRGWVSGRVGYSYRSARSIGLGAVSEYGDGLTYHAQIGFNPTWRGQEFGWMNLDATGLDAVDDGRTKSFHQVSLGGAVRIGEKAALELSYGRVYAAVAMGEAHAISLGLSHSL